MPTQQGSAFINYLHRLLTRGYNPIQVFSSHMDPDSFMSMLFFGEMARVYFQKKVLYIISNTDTHPQCKIVLDQFPYFRYEGLATLRRDLLTFMLDCNYNDSRIPRDFHMPKCVVIDHHTCYDQTYFNIPRAWIDIKVGSCTTMLYELIEYYQIKINATMAACACAAIIIDTQGELIGRDKIVFDKMYSIADKKLYLKIMNYEPDLQQLLEMVTLTGTIGPVSLYSTDVILEADESPLLATLAQYFFEKYKRSCIVSATVRVGGRLKLIMKGRSTGDVDLSPYFEEHLDKSRYGSRQTPSGEWMVGGSQTVEFKPLPSV
jgi:hypothetical protein